MTSTEDSHPAERPATDPPRPRPGLGRRRLGRLPGLVGVVTGLIATAAALMVASSTPAAASDPTFVSGRYFWTQGAAAVPMRPSSTDVCVLTRVAGNFRGAGESVRVYNSGGYWWLSGTSKQDGVNAAATCYRLSGFRTPTGTARWISPEIAAAWTNGGNCVTRQVNSWWGDAATYLSGISGDFAGGGEHGAVEQSANGFAPSVIRGSACQDNDSYAIRAHAFFAGAPSSGQVARYVFRTADGIERTLPYDPQAQWFLSAANGNTATYVMAPTDSAMCYLSFIGGKFRGGGEYVDLSPQVIAGVERWVLRVHSQQNDYADGAALCYARNQ